jgi:poly(A)-specific ribonuclease
LETLRFETSREAFKNPRIDMHSEFPRYLTEMAHEAGYDAYMTGTVFLKLVSYLDNQRNQEKYATLEAQRLAEEEQKELDKLKETKVDADGWDISEEEEEENGETSQWDLNEEEDVYNYGSIRIDLLNKDGKMDNVLLSINNKTALVRTAYDCFDFVSDEIISNQSNAIHVSYAPGSIFTKEVAALLFSKYGKHIVEANDNQSSFVIFENLREDPNNIRIESEEYVIIPVSKYFSDK